MTDDQSTKNTKKIPIWDNETKIVYNDFLEKEHACDNHINLGDTIDNTRCTNKISSLINKLHTGMRKSLEIISMDSDMNRNKKFEINWTEEEDAAKIALKELKNTWKLDKSNEIKLKIKIAKRRLKSIRETNKKYVEEKLTSKLNKDFCRDNRKYWKKMDKLLNQKVTSEIDINSAKRMFEELFNKEIMDDMNTDYSKLDEFVQNNKNKIYNYSINEADLINILSGLNNNCAQGFSSLPNECFKYGININTIKLIKVIIETFVNYNIKPKFFNVGLVKIIVKDQNKDTKDPSNIRPITISDTIAIIFEKLMILEINKSHKPIKEQFGFKSLSSCEHAVFALRELVKHNKRKSKVSILCALDASKAFDKVRRNKLWLTMMDKVQPYVIRALMNYYDDLKLIVSNNNEYSAMFGTSLGVKQGGPASPRLFTIYMEPLSNELNKLNVGIHLGDLIINHLMYADDVLLLASNIADLNMLLQVTSKFGIDYELKFNPSKTQFMICDRFRSKRKFDLPYFNGESLKRIYKLKYLGMNLTPELKTIDHLEIKIRDSIYKMVQLKRCSFTSKHSISKMKINQYKTYIRSTLLYGTENQLLIKKEIREMQTTESTIIKKAFGFQPRFTKSTNLNRALNLDRINDRLYKSKYKFLIRLEKNELTNMILSELFKEKSALYDKESLLGYINCINAKLDKTATQMIKSMSDNIRLKNKKYISCGKSDLEKQIVESVKLKGDERKKQLARHILMTSHWLYNYYNNI